VNPDDQHHPWAAQPDADAPFQDEAMLRAAADDVRRLHQISVPADFAAKLEARVRARARALARTPPSAPTPGQRWSHLPPVQRAAIIGGSSFVALLLLLGIIIYGAANSLPGDWLYGLKQFGESIALSQAHTPAAKAQVAVGQLHGALADVRAEIRDHRSDADIDAALAVVISDTKTATSLTNAISGQADRTAAKAQLTQALGDEQQTLRQALPQLDWPLRLDFTAQLGAIGAAVPQIASVTVGQTAEGKVPLQIHGSDFSSGAVVVLDGATVGAPQSLAATQLTIAIPAALWDGRDHSVGVQNPDGTAAEIAVTNTSHGHGNPHPTATPNPSGTPGHGNPHPSPEPDATPSHGHHGATPTPGSGQHGSNPGKGGGGG
jgi:hypothetical protein